MLFQKEMRIPPQAILKPCNPSIKDIGGYRHGTTSCPIDKGLHEIEQVLGNLAGHRRSRL